MKPEEMSQEVEMAGAGLVAPLFLPHLAGERAPLWDATARGAFLGLGAGMGRAAMARGVFEGVALSARLLVNSLEASTGTRAQTLLCGGGGFRSDVWNQIRADVLGCALRRTAVSDAGVVGAAALAAVAATLQPDLRSALSDLVIYDRTFEPDPRQADRYDDLFALYRPTYEALRPINRALASNRADPSGVPRPPG
jgi:xylulokinase